MNIQGSNQSQNIADLRQNFARFQTTEQDSTATRALKSIKRHFSKDYKNIKSQLTKTLQETNFPPISDRRIQKVSAGQVRTLLNQYYSFEKAARIEADFSSQSRVTTEQAPAESVPLSEEGIYMSIDTQGLSRQNSSQPSVSYQAKFDDLSLKTKQVLANQETYPFDQIHGGARFKNILPPVNTAVHTPTDQPMNANYVFDKSYIATQAPLVGTKDKEQNSIPAFFSMIKNSDSDTVVNLTGKADETKKDLISQYWPDQGQSKSYRYGNEVVAVNTTSVTSESGYDIVKLYIQETINNQWPLTDDGKAKGKEITVFHFKEWPDHGVPKEEQLGYYKNFKKTVENHDGSPQKFVHCKAGVGRTGTFMTENEIKKGIDSGTINEHNLEQTIDNTILKGRRDRGPQFVQSKFQYQLIIEEAREYLQQTSTTAKNNVPNESVYGNWTQNNVPNEPVYENWTQNKRLSPLPASNRPLLPPKPKR